MQYIHIFCYQFIHTCKTKTIISEPLGKVNYFMYFGGLRFKKKNKQRVSILKKKGDKENQYKNLSSLHFDSQIIEIYSWNKHILLSIYTDV